MKIKKDMMVKVVSGNFKGMTGKVLKVIPYVQLKKIHKEAFQKEKDRYMFLT